MRVKIRKKLPKATKKQKSLMKNIVVPKKENQFTNIYLNFYDDIKIPSKKYDW